MPRPHPTRCLNCGRDKFQVAGMLNPQIRKHPLCFECVSTARRCTGTVWYLDDQSAYQRKITRPPEWVCRRCREPCRVAVQGADPPDYSDLCEAHWQEREYCQGKDPRDGRRKCGNVKPHWDTLCAACRAAADTKRSRALLQEWHKAKIICEWCWNSVRCPPHMYCTACLAEKGIAKVDASQPVPIRGEFMTVLPGSKADAIMRRAEYRKARRAQYDIAYRKRHAAELRKKRQRRLAFMRRDAPGKGDRSRPK